MAAPSLPNYRSPRHCTNPNPNSPFPRLSYCSQTLILSSKLTVDPPPAPEEKKSLAIATGGMFLGIAAKIIRSRSGGRSVEVEMFRDTEERAREDDVEAERGWKAVTGPGFSFSAAGLLFPYHLGVAQFLIEKFYQDFGARKVFDEMSTRGVA